MSITSHSRPRSAQPRKELIASRHKPSPAKRKPRQGQELWFEDNELALGNEKTARVSADHYQNSGDKVPPANHKEGYQFEWFDNCERNRKDQERLVRTKPVEETVKHPSNLASDHNTVAARSFAEVLDAPDSAPGTHSRPHAEPELAKLENYPPHSESLLWGKERGRKEQTQPTTICRAASALDLARVAANQRRGLAS
jgi:hypothetical protein